MEIEERNGLKLPEWTIKYYNRQMREIAARSLSLFTSNTLQQRLRGGIKIVKDPKTSSYYNLIFICIYSYINTVVENYDLQGGYREYLVTLKG